MYARNNKTKSVKVAENSGNLNKRLTLLENKMKTLIEELNYVKLLLRDNSRSIRKNNSNLSNLSTSVKMISKLHK